MTTPAKNQAIAAAAPVLRNFIGELQTFVNTTLEGDPAQIGLRMDGAFKVLAGNVELQLPVLATAEIDVVKTDINAKLASWDAALAALEAPASPTLPSSTAAA